MSVRLSARPSRRHGRWRMGAGFQWALLFTLGATIHCVVREPAPTAPRTAWYRSNHQGFLAVAYHAVGCGARDTVVSPERFREQVGALLDAGFTPISAGEACEFLAHGMPLPDKAVLLVVCDGLFETYRHVEPVLARLRVPALMVLRTEPMARNDRGCITWHHARMLARTGRWDFGVCGHEALRSVPAVAAGASGPFLTTRMYREADKRVETEADWRARVTADLRRAATLLSTHVPGWTPRFFTYPWSKDGRDMADGGSALSAVVGALFACAFSGGDYAFNPAGTPPLALSRLIVRHEWTAQDLVQRLAAYAPRQTEFRGTPSVAWVRRHGNLVVDAGAQQVLLSPDRGHGAEAWIAGSDVWRCLSGSVTLETRPGVQTWVYLRARPGAHFLRIGWTGERIELQCRVGGAPVHALHRVALPAGAAAVRMTFEVFLSRLCFDVEGAASPRRSFRIPPALVGGMAGIGMWASGADRSPAAFAGIRFLPRQVRARFAGTLDDVRASAGFPVDVVMPRWYRLESTSDGTRIAGEEDRSLVHLAAWHGSDVWPVFRVDSQQDLAAAAVLADEVQRIMAAGAYGCLVLDLGDARPALPLLVDLEALVQAWGVPLALYMPRGAEAAAQLAPTCSGLRWIVVAPDQGVLPVGRAPSIVVHGEG